MDVPTMFLPQQDIREELNELRRRTRRAVCMLVTVEGNSGLAQGVVTNISESGCRLRLVTPFRVGHHLALTINPQDETNGLRITLAGNRWIEDEFIGVEFLSLSQKDKAKLRQLCGESRPTLQ